MKDKSIIISSFRGLVEEYMLDREKNARTSFGYYSQGEKGLERKDKLVQLLDEMQKEKYSAEEVLVEIYDFYQGESAFSSKLLDGMRRTLLFLLDIKIHSSFFGYNSHAKSEDTQMQIFINQMRYELKPKVKTGLSI